MSTTHQNLSSLSQSADAAAATVIVPPSGVDLESAGKSLQMAATGGARFSPAPLEIPPVAT